MTEKPDTIEALRHRIRHGETDLAKPPTVGPLPHDFRRARGDDITFILKAWIQELRHCVLSSWIEDGTFFSGQKAIILELIHKHGAMLAHEPGDEEHLYGYVCFGEGAVHWLYVKSAFRLMGIGRSLLREAKRELGLTDFDKVPCTHASGIFGHRELRTKYQLQFNPYLLRVKYGQSASVA